MNDRIAYRRTRDVEKVRELIVGIHVEVRGEFGLMDRPFYQRERFNERLTAYSSRPGWEAVVGYQGEEPVGYVFAVPLGEDTGWWSAEREPLAAKYVTEDGTRTLALNEILVRRQWRGAKGKGLRMPCTRSCCRNAKRSASHCWSIQRFPRGASRLCTSPGATSRSVLSSRSTTRRSSRR